MYNMLCHPGVGLVWKGSAMELNDCKSVLVGGHGAE